MKIKNELVSLKIGNKQYDFKNLILDEYLKRFILKQLDTTTPRYILHQLYLDTVFFKFDTPIKNLSPSSDIFPEDFDIAFVNGCKSVITTATPNLITTKYTYDMNNFIYDYNKKKGGNLPFEDYYGKKIVAIGFGTSFSSFTKKNKVCAILDTSNYNIYMQASQKLECTRKDTISTDALFWSSDARIKAPVHLYPYGGEPLLYQDPYPGFREEDKKIFNARSALPTKGVLYSIALSSSPQYIIDNEFVIGKDVNVVQNEAKLSIQGINNNFETELYSNFSIYPSSNLYPVKSNYKYIIFKYKVYQEIEKGVYGEDNTLDFEYIQTDTKSYYYQAIPIDKFGESNFIIKYERGKENV